MFYFNLSNFDPIHLWHQYCFFYRQKYYFHDLIELGRKIFKSLNFRYFLGYMYFMILFVWIRVPNVVFRLLPTTFGVLDVAFWETVVVVWRKIGVFEKWNYCQKIMGGEKQLKKSFSFVHVLQHWDALAVLQSSKNQIFWFRLL